MTDFGTAAAQAQNIDRPFTELFSLLRSNVITDGCLTMKYESHDLKIMYEHVENAIDILIQGIQDVGGLLGYVSQGKSQISNMISNIGSLIVVLGNLTEALNGLRMDADFTLRVRGEVVDH